MSLREPCWQCDLDIPHVCYHGMPDARWGLHDGAIEALEAAQKYLAPKRRAAGSNKRRSR
ncbi:MAG TPA: hypothetical protein VLE97_08795 [Gaiellaceae bacterium]|nr:hypothetical protein [Gaiellaceae bacterium]